MLGSETVTIKRISGSDSITDYKVNARSYSTSTMKATIVSVPGDILQILELLERTQDTRYVVSVESVSNGDLITISGTDYEVIHVFHDERHGFLSHYESVAIKVKE